MKGKKTGGRTKGTPNKDNPLKYSLHAHSSRYYQPTIPVNQQLADALTPPDAPAPLTPQAIAIRLGVPVGDMVSPFDIDLLQMEPAARASAEEKILRYHTPQMQAVSADLSLQSPETTTLELRLAQLSKPPQPK